MSYFVPYLDATGLHFPTYSEVMEFLCDRYRKIFGSDVYLGEDTMDYQLLSLYAYVWDDQNAIMLDTYNARNPNWAYGTALDGLMALTGIRRNPATYSKVQLLLGGVLGSTMDGGRVRDANGYTWKFDETVTFSEPYSDRDYGNIGRCVVWAECTTAGAIGADVDTINIIETPTYNWYTATNPGKPNEGLNVETDAEARARRKRSVALPARSTLDGIIAGLINIEEVTACNVYENTKDETDERGIPGHSIYCLCDYNGEDPAIEEKIAKMIFLKKAPGIGTWGGTRIPKSVTYVDEYRNSNTVRFSKPVSKTVNVTVKVHKLDTWDVNTSEDMLKQAVQTAIDGMDIAESLIVPTLYAECYAALNGASPGFAIMEIKAGTNASSMTSSTVGCEFDARIRCGTVTVVDAGSVG